MSERKDDIIIGLLVVIIVLQVYGLFLGNSSSAVGGAATWQDYGSQEVTTLPADVAEPVTDSADVQAALGEAVKAADTQDNPQSGANVPGVPAGKAQAPVK